MNVQTDGPRWKAVFLSLVLLGALAHQGCDGKAFEDVRERAAVSSILVSPATLASWLGEGYGTDAFGYRKLVVLDVSAASSYTAGHVPGAFHLDAATELSASRSDGIGGTYSYTDTNSVVWTELNSPTEVVSSDVMNAVIRRTGIDRNTVVALVGDSLFNVSLAYFNFRYWGFPKERMRVLDRTKAAYVTAGYALTTAMPPAPAPSSYRVCDLTQNTSLRATLTDMIRLADGAVPGGLAWDVRTPNEYDGVAGATAGPFSGKLGYAKKVAFEGHVAGAVNLAYNALLTDANSTILDEGTVRAALDAKGITREVRTHVY